MSSTIIADSENVNLKRAGSKALNRVRIVGKIKGFTGNDSQDSKAWISVNKPEASGLFDKVTVSFDTQSSRKDAYELDYCYEQDEDTGLIYEKEIKPMISEVLDGKNASIIALGPKGSGKTYIIQGSEEKPGLAVMAMDEILSTAKEVGKMVCVSLYEVTQDHAYDLLDPKHPEVQVLGDGQGKINLKGLSKVPVISISEFHNIYFGQSSVQKYVPKIPMELSRSHKGLIIHISSRIEKQRAKSEGKINFVDLAAYEDPRRSSKDGTTLVESNRTNKALHALLRVVCALNANESCVPYRESKLTRILQDSLSTTSHVLMLTCLNPSFCQDSICSVSLVSRSCRSTKQVLTDTTNRSKCSAKVKVLSTIKTGRTPSSTMKKPVLHSKSFSEKKTNSILRGRKLFGEGKANNPKQLRSPSGERKPELFPNNSVTPFSLEQASQDTAVSEADFSKEPTDNTSVPSSLNEVECTTLVEKETSMHAMEPCGIDRVDSSLNKRNDIEATLGNNSDAKALALVDGSTNEGDGSLQIKDVGSPLLSERLRELSDNLKALYSSTPLRIMMPEEMDKSHGRCDVIDPKTPMTERRIEQYYSPRGTFSNRSAGVKNALVQEYLNFLNSASKEELKSLKGIGEKRAAYILELREESPEPFKSLDDLQEIGLSAKQIKGMMKKAAGDLFN